MSSNQPITVLTSDIALANSNFNSNDWTEAPMSLPLSHPTDNLYLGYQGARPYRTRIVGVINGEPVYRQMLYPVQNTNVLTIPTLPITKSKASEFKLVLGRVCDVEMYFNESLYNKAIGAFYEGGILTDTVSIFGETIKTFYANSNLYRYHKINRLEYRSRSMKTVIDHNAQFSNDLALIASVYDTIDFINIDDISYEEFKHRYLALIFSLYIKPIGEKYIFPRYEFARTKDSVDQTPFVFSQ